jgi:hypothetical protein
VSPEVDSKRGVNRIDEKVYVQFLEDINRSANAAAVATIGSRSPGEKEHHGK